MDRLSTLLDPASLTALAAMNHLLPIAEDEQQAWENIEMIADAIDVIVDLVEKNHMSDETGKAATVDYLLKMLNSPCEDVVKLALSGLDRIVFKTEIAVYAVRMGAFDYLANLIVRTEDGQYEKFKSSDVLAFLMAPPENKYLKTSALTHKVFDEHINMVMKGNEKARERGLQFLWCITHNCKEAQEKVMTKQELFPIILQAIADADCGRNALRLLHNLSKSDNAKKRLPVKEISNLVKPIMNIPDHIISKKDKAITSLTVANLLESGQAVDAVVVEYLRDMVYELVQASFYSSKFTLMEVISCFNNLASKEENKLTLFNCNLVKTLIDTIKLADAPEKVIGKGYTLNSVKEMAAKTLWYLAYSEAIQKKMREEAGGLDELKAIYAQVQEEKLKKNLKDILWIFELKDANQKMSNLKGNISTSNLRALGSSVSKSLTNVTPTSPSASPTPSRAMSPLPTYSPSAAKAPATYSFPSKTTTSSSPSSSPTSSTAPSKPAYSVTKTPATTSESSASSLSASPSPSPTPSSPSPTSQYKPSSQPSYKPPTPSASSTSTAPKTTTAPKYTPPSPAASAPKYGSKPPATSSTASESATPGEKPKWMVGGAKQPTTSPTTATGAKPSWLVTSKK